MTKIANYLLAVVFIVFAWLQVNDSDPRGWMLLYFYVAAVCLFAAYKRKNKYVIIAGVAVCLIWMGFLFPEFINWVKIGMPNIAGQMKAATPYIEYTREFLGLSLCLVVLVWQLRK